MQPNGFVADAFPDDVLIFGIIDFYECESEFWMKSLDTEWTSKIAHAASAGTFMWLPLSKPKCLYFARESYRIKCMSLNVKSSIAY